MHIRSSITIPPNKDTPIADRINIAANTLSVRNCDADLIIRYPSPELAPTHSPTTAPITLTVIAILIPENRKGKDVGSLSFVSTCIRLAPRDLNIRTMSGSTDFKPSTILTTIGKIAIKITTIIFGQIPYPIHIISSGAITTTGIVCEVIMIGYVGVKARKRKRRYIYIVFFIIILFIVVYFGYNIEGEKKEINNEIISTNGTKDLDQLSLDKEELEIKIFGVINNN